MKRYRVEWPALVGIWPTLLDWSQSCSCAHTDCMAAAMIASSCCCNMSVTCWASCADWWFKRLISHCVSAIFVCRSAIAFAC